MSGNGTDLGHLTAMLQSMVVSQDEMRMEMREMRVGMQSLNRRVDDLARDVADLRQDVADLRQEVRAYHGSVLGHGVLISELDERTTRVERHLDLPPRAA